MDGLDFFAKWQNTNIASSFTCINANAGNNVMDEVPALYNIYMINNANIPVSFYVFVIEEFFSQKNDNLVKSFNLLRKNGYISYGTFTKDVAESKISLISEVAKSSNYLLKCIMCKDNGDVIKKS
jgi:ATP-dependent Clp protease adaptor protein ClpS